jgi:hypothetical protein
MPMTALLRREWPQADHLPPAAPRHVTAQLTFSMSPGVQLLSIAASVGP